jgi:hypothetical protein
MGNLQFISFWTHLDVPYFHGHQIFFSVYAHSLQHSFQILKHIPKSNLKLWYLFH